MFREYRFMQLGFRLSHEEYLDLPREWVSWMLGIDATVKGN